MNLFEELRRIADLVRMKHKWVDEILIHRQFVARGYVYLVEYQERFFILMNSYDLDIAASQMPSVSTGYPFSYVMGIPVCEDGEKIKRIMTGVWNVPDYNYFLPGTQDFISSQARH
jgi:hypothetical protein